MRYRNVLALLTVALVAAEITYADSTANARPRSPNFLIVIGDDCTYKDLPLYGGQNVKTPNIDRLAAGGLTFDRAYLAMSMCNPCRTELYTGLYPARSGACWNHSAARPGTKSVVHYLGGLGYRVGLTGKKHVVPGPSFRFEQVKGVEGGCVSQTAKFDDAGMKAFMSRDPDQPFYLAVGLVVPHCPWTVGEAANFDPKKLKLPPNLADTPATRSDFAKYLAEIEVLDKHVGLTLKALEETGQDGNTLVIFTSEQGSQFPGNKWTNWNTGVHTGFVVRWTGRVEAGRRTGALIQYADVLPTLIEAAGGKPKANDFDGTSFLPVLLGNADRHRTYAYFMHNNIPEGPPYPVRAVTDGTYHYIRNLAPENLYIEKHLMGEIQWHAYWPTWVAQTGPWEGQNYNREAVRLINRFMRRPAEELYRVDLDPYEMNNLVDVSEGGDAKARLSGELDRWMSEQGDPGAALDTEEQWRASQAGNHFERTPSGR